MDDISWYDIYSLAQRLSSPASPGRVTDPEVVEIALELSLGQRHGERVGGTLAYVAKAQA